MSGKRIGWVALLVLTIGTLGSSQAQFLELTRGDELSRFGNSGFGLDKKIAGTWLGLGSFSVDFGCDGAFDLLDIPVIDAHTFGPGGMHSAVNPANPNTNLGSWEWIGPRTLSGRDVSFSVDASPGGAVTFVSVVTFTVEFDKRLEVATSSFGAKVYLPTQDPLDPAEMPVACSSGKHDSFRKVSPQE